MSFYKHFWKKKKRKGLFGGEILSHDEIRHLSKKIKGHEEKEMEQADVELEESLKEL